jgi:peptidyl-tRNA hydrolase
MSQQTFYSSHHDSLSVTVTLWKSDRYNAIACGSGRGQKQEEVRDVVLEKGRRMEQEEVD